MCGILVYPKSKNISVKEFEKLIHHRGPDASKSEIINKLIFSHSLLQIRGELQPSIQPRYSKSQRYLILFNGQIYNTKYLDSIVNVDDKDLDTNYLDSITDKFGIDGLKYIDGMYAIVIYDLKLKKLYFTRDPSGQKNLYYHINNQNEIFISSEIYPILKISNSPKKLSKNGVMEYFLMGYNSGRYTIYNKIFKLLPGEIIEYCSQSLRIVRQNLLEKKLEQNYGDIKNIIKKNVSNHLLSKKKIAINLSGGIDSNLILFESIKTGYRPEVFSTYCKCTDDNFNQDFYLAEKIANKYNLKFHKTEVNKEDFLNKVKFVNEILEEPSRNSGNTLYYLNFMKQKQKKFKSIISGSGGDEIFIGYPYLFFNRKYQIILNLFNKIFYNDYLTKLLINSVSDFQKYQPLKENLSVSLKKLSSRIKSNFLQNVLNHKKIFFPGKKYSSLSFLKLIVLQYGWLANESFVSYDKLSMNNSIEVRSPFASHEFRNQVLVKIQDKDFLSEFNKPLIRSSYEKILDPIIIGNKKKTGWPVPEEWLISKEFHDMFESLIPQEDDVIKWSSFKEKFLSEKINKKNIKKMYSVFSFLCIKKKLNLSF